MWEGKKVKLAVCEHCHSRCQVMVHSENGRLVRFEKADSDPMADQIKPPTMACLRLNGVKEWFYNPDRVNFPQKRAGEKGEGKWQKISWEQAFDEIGHKLKKIIDQYGPEAVAGTRGTQRTNEEFIARFFNVLGSPNYGGQSSICYSPSVVTSKAMFGFPPSRFSRFPGNKGCMFVIGNNPSESQTRIWKFLHDCKEKGGIKLIVADPRRTKTAEMADLWLQHRPGSDTALIMSMINVIVKEELYDKVFVEKWCYGFDKLAERAAEYPPEKVADICWLTPDQIRAAARMYATNTPSVAWKGMGLEHLSNCIEALQALHILPALTGSIDVPGGQWVPGPAPDFLDCAEMSALDVISPEQKAKQIDTSRFRLLGWPGWDLIASHTEKIWEKPVGQPGCDLNAHMPSIIRAMVTDKPYPVRACITVANNPMVTLPNTKLVFKALKSLDLYVVNEYWMTPSAELADYVLPTASWIERPFLYSSGGGIGYELRGGEQALPAVIPGEYDHRNDFEIFREISVRLGLGKYWPWKTLEESYDYRLAPRGITFKDFIDKEKGNHMPPMVEKLYEKIGFATSTGKIELYSMVLENLGYDPLPRYQEAHENPITKPELTKDYPYMLITGGRFQPMFHSEQRQVDLCRRKHPHPLVQIHPDTAKAEGIDNGDWVWIESPRGRIRMKSKLFDGIDPRVVHAEHGWWFPELPGEEPWLHGVWESNINVLTDDSPDVCNEKSGGWPLRTALVRIYKTKQFY